MLLNKLVPIINKYGYNCNKKISIITDDQKNEFIVNLPKIFENTEIGDSNDSCFILFWFKNAIRYNENLVESINKHLNNDKILLLIVPLDFDFNHLIKNTIANGIDAISWHGKNQIKYYFIILTKR